MDQDITDAAVRMINALGRWEREGTEEARLAHEAARARVLAYANFGKAKPNAQPRRRHLRLVHDGRSRLRELRTGELDVSKMDFAEAQASR